MTEKVRLEWNNVELLIANIHHTLPKEEVGEWVEWEWAQLLEVLWVV